MAIFVARMRVRHIIVLLGAAALLYLFAWQTGHDFGAFAVAPARPLPRALAADTRLDGLRRTTTLPEGPEDIALDARGDLYTGTADGHLYVLERGSDRWRAITLTYGRPLGLAFGPDDRWLYVADAERGLMRTDKQGHLERIVDTTADGRDLGLVDDLAVGPDGAVYFTSASDNWPLDAYEGAVLAHDRTGRLFRYRPREQTLELLADSLAFANGVALAPGGDAVYVAQTTDYSVLRYPITADGTVGPAERFAEGLPGFPDGLTFGPRGRLWVALADERDARLDALAAHPLLREAIYKLPEGFGPRPRYRASVIALDTDGRIVDRLGTSGAEDAYRGITNAVWRGDTLWVGSLVERSVAYWVKM